MVLAKNAQSKFAVEGARVPSLLTLFHLGFRIATARYIPEKTVA
jgi:hypothetical protein